MKRVMFFFLLAILSFSFIKKEKSILLHYDDRPSTKEWWRYNDKVKFEFRVGGKDVKPVASGAFLKVQWPYSGQEDEYTWFTDLKIDSLRNPKMEPYRKSLGSTIWLSFWCRVNSKDSLYVHPMVLSANHKGKWGCKDMTLITSNKWAFYKYNLSKLSYEKWGKEGGNQPDFKTTEVRCFEVGLRKGKGKTAGSIDADFDNLMISNFEPNGNE
jgi:hypothetical protein